MFTPYTGPTVPVAELYNWHIRLFKSYEKSKQSDAAAEQMEAHTFADGIIARLPRSAAALPLTSIKGPSNAPERHPRGTVTVVLVCVTVVCVTVDVVAVVDETDVDVADVAVVVVAVVVVQRSEVV